MLLKADNEGLHIRMKMKKDIASKGAYYGKQHLFRLSKIGKVIHIQTMYVYNFYSTFNIFQLNI